jgi:hypothetical protein
MVYVDPIDPDNPVTAALPANGWRAVYKDLDGSFITTQVIGWLVHADGSVQPRDVGSDGAVSNPKSCANFIQLLEPGEELPNAHDTTEVPVAPEQCPDHPDRRRGRCVVCALAVPEEA